MGYQKIKIASIILMALVSIFVIFWTYRFSSGIIPHIFTNEWATYAWVDDNVVVTPFMRFLAFIFYAPVYVVAFAAAYFFIRYLNYSRKGIVFDPRPANNIIGGGLALIGILIVDTYIPAFEAKFLSQWNSGKSLPAKYYFDSADITIGLAGLGFCLIGWVLKEAILLKQENESII